MCRYVAYYRVSTAGQGRSGLGLDGQKTAVHAHIGSGELLGEFVEVESGKINSRPQLAAAIALARRNKATLIIAKLDRLARNVAFVANLLESGVEFIAADFPAANRMMLQILAVFAEAEAKMICKRQPAITFWSVGMSATMAAWRSAGSAFGCPVGRGM